jgi:hypothetical protein
MLSEQGVLHDLVTLSHSSCAGDETLARHTKLVVATAILHLTAREEPIPANLLDNCLQVMLQFSMTGQHLKDCAWVHAMQRVIAHMACCHPDHSHLDCTVHVM